jgi:hypothetical protein
MKEQILDIIGFGIEPERAELKASQLIVLFNQHMLDKAKESKTLADLIEKSFINL